MIGERWGVTDDEVARWYPCDDVIPDAPIQLWRGMTIEVPPAQVWPWVRQLRLAPYSEAMSQRPTARALGSGRV